MAVTFVVYCKTQLLFRDLIGHSIIQADNGNVHRAAAKIIVSKNRAARGSACNVLLSRASCEHLQTPKVERRLIVLKYTEHWYMGVSTEHD